VDGRDEAVFKIDFGRNSLNNPDASASPGNGLFSRDRDVDDTETSRFKRPLPHNIYNTSIAVLLKII